MPCCQRACAVTCTTWPRGACSRYSERVLRCLHDMQTTFPQDQRSHQSGVNPQESAPRTMTSGGRKSVNAEPVQRIHRPIHGSYRYTPNMGHTATDNTVCPEATACPTARRAIIRAETSPARPRECGGVGNGNGGEDEMRNPVLHYDCCTPTGLRHRQDAVPGSPGRIPWSACPSPL